MLGANLVFKPDLLNRTAYFVKRTSTSCTKRASIYKRSYKSVDKKTLANTPNFPAAILEVRCTIEMSNNDLNTKSLGNEALVSMLFRVLELPGGEKTFLA